ncbi:MULTISPECIES: IS3 family transposase [unclassified Salinivibrio]|uniref:IS3 family transposase n=1 Tax=unclassified Salinivibrio TaxID=2636825 RepID=UPI001561B8E7
MSRSGYYDWLSRGQSGHARADSELGAEIAFIYRKSEGRHGSPKIHAALKAKGLAVSRKRVARLMREAGLKARVDRVYRRQKKSRTFFKGLVNRRFGLDPFYWTRIDDLRMLVYQPHLVAQSPEWCVSTKSQGEIANVF